VQSRKLPDRSPPCTTKRARLKKVVSTKESQVWQIRQTDEREENEWSRRYVTVVHSFVRPPRASASVVVVGGGAADERLTLAQARTFVFVEEDVSKGKLEE
jgi:hypothetical protein